ncbi:MAG TPA: hypothetical protein VF518_01015, partial [Polyangia bacterium]
MVSTKPAQLTPELGPATDAKKKRCTNLTEAESGVVLGPTCSAFTCNTRSKTMSYGDMKIYRTFEEFEREEL